MGWMVWVDDGGGSKGGKVAKALVMEKAPKAMARAKGNLASIRLPLAISRTRPGCCVKHINAPADASMGITLH